MTSYPVNPNVEAPLSYPPYPPPSYDSTLSAIPLHASHSDPHSFKKAIQDHRPTSHPNSVLGKMSTFSERYPEVVLGLKVLAVVAVFAGLLAASVFTFGAALPLVAAITTSSSVIAAAGSFALLGTAVGLALSSFLTLVFAKWTDMFKVTKDNIGDVFNFVALSAVGSTAVTGLFTAFGAGLGVKGIVAAKAGLGVGGALMVVGTGGTLVKMFIEHNSRE